MSEEKRYRLCASTSLNIPEGIKYSFVPSHMKYSLIYTDMSDEDLRNIGYIAINEADVKLNAQESTWLIQCKLNINVRYMRENEAVYAEQLDKFLDVLEKELAATEAKKV